MLASQIPSRFDIPFADSAVAPYVRDVPKASQIGIQDGAASLTTGFPPLTFDPVASGGVPPFGADFNGLLKQMTAWLRWQGAGGPVGYDATFASAIGGYPEGAVIAAATLGLFWLSTIDSNTTDPEAGPSTDWQGFGLGNSGVTAGSYVRPQITVDSDGRVSSAANGTYPTYTSLLSGSGNFTTPTGAKRLSIRMIGPGGGGSTSAVDGSTSGTPTSFASVVAAAGIKATAAGGGGAGGSGGTGTAKLRIAGGAGQGSMFLTNGLAIGGQGGNGAFGGGGKADGNGATNTGGGGGGHSLQGGGLVVGGSGGGAGEYVELVINNPSGDYAYVVGTAGAGAAGTGSGAAGAIYIEALYD